MIAATLVGLACALAALGLAIRENHRFEASVRVSIRRQQLAHERLCRTVENLRLSYHGEPATMPLEPTMHPFKLEHRDWRDSRVSTRQLGSAQTFPEFFVAAKRNG